MTDENRMYLVNDIFYSIQGEGARVGTPNLFLRFSGCNLRCAIAEGEKSPGGFNCDTEFVSGSKMTALEIVARFKELSPVCKWVICTGGEPALQLDPALREALFTEGYSVAIETNGSININHLNLDWITVSPKVAEHCIMQREADEVKYVRNYAQAIPRTVVEGRNRSPFKLFKFISPAFEGEQLPADNLAWCEKLVKENPEWSLTIQLHKLINVR